MVVLGWVTVMLFSRQWIGEEGCQVMNDPFKNQVYIFCVIPVNGFERELTFTPVKVSIIARCNA
jgi:hypothetical protein